MAEQQNQLFQVGIKGIIRRETGILVFKDRKHDKWELPGGRIKPGYTAEGAFAAELLEEIPGADFVELTDTIHDAIGDFELPDESRLFLIFKLATVVLPEVIELSDEHSEMSFVNKQNLGDHEFFSTDHAAIVIALDMAA